MIGVLMDHASRTGRALQQALGDEGGPVQGLVNWTGAPQVEAILPMLNSASRTDKLAQLVRLQLMRVNVPPYTLDRLPEHGGDWYPRTSTHQQGRDFTTGGFTPDFWVKKLEYEDEWRIHVFKTGRGNYRILRSGLKIPNRVHFHPWVRSHRLGWKISYRGGASDPVKEIARRAVAALALDFGAVDVAQTAEPTVLEVNTCPGLDTGTLRLYVDAIKERFSLA